MEKQLQWCNTSGLH